MKLTNLLGYFFRKFKNISNPTQEKKNLSSGKHVQQQKKINEKRSVVI